MNRGETRRNSHNGGRIDPAPLARGEWPPPPFEPRTSLALSASAALTRATNRCSASLCSFHLALSGGSPGLGSLQERAGRHPWAPAATRAASRAGRSRGSSGGAFFLFFALPPPLLPTPRGAGGEEEGPGGGAPGLGQLALRALLALLALLEVLPLGAGFGIEGLLELAALYFEP